MQTMSLAVNHGQQRNLLIDSLELSEELANGVRDDADFGEVRSRLHNALRQLEQGYWDAFVAYAMTYPSRDFTELLLSSRD